MGLQRLLAQKGITKYYLSKISGIPKTTIADICAGRSDIGRCSAMTVQLLARALDCTMEEILEKAAYDDETGLPLSQGYLECGLPDFLAASVDNMRTAWERIDRGEKYLRWDCDYCTLQSDINNAEVNQLISSEQAWYLREKYLRIERIRSDESD